jgi:hypothetical protein
MDYIKGGHCDSCGEVIGKTCLCFEECQTCGSFVKDCSCGVVKVDMKKENWIKSITPFLPAKWHLLFKKEDLLKVLEEIYEAGVKDGEDNVVDSPADYFPTRGEF